MRAQESIVFSPLNSSANCSRTRKFVLNTCWGKVIYKRSPLTFKRRLFAAYVE